MFVPHQLGLSVRQPVALLKGGAVLIPHSSMGSDKGEYVMMLQPQNARKLLTAYKKGKGIKIKLTPDEIRETIKSGRGFLDKAKKVYAKSKEFLGNLLDNPALKEVGKAGLKKGAEAIGVAVGSYFGNPEIGKNIGKVVGEAGANALDKRDINVAKYELANKAKEAGLEYATQEGRRRIKQNVDDDLTRGLAYHTLNVANKKVGATTGEQDLKRLGLGAKRPKMVKGSQEAKDYMAMIRAKKGKGIGSDILGGLKKVGRYAIPATTGTLGGLAGGVATGGNPLGAIVGSASGSYGGQKLVEKLGIEGAGMKRRGRPRKVVGMGATSSQPFKQALRLNYGGLQLFNDEINNAPLSSFNQVNPKVIPSSTQMTLSPYASINSPAMNPFIPAYYTQQGGTSCGYGGKGLYTSAGKGFYHNMGKGLY
jgi:hypothetical protein